MTASVEPTSALGALRIRLRGIFKPRLAVFGAKYRPDLRRLTREADVLLVWFPKTGGTWVRLLLNTALSEHTNITPSQPLEFVDFKAAGMPLIRPLHEDEPHWKRPEQLTPTKAAYADKRIILLVRDPRDTMVSLWFQMTRRWQTTRAPLHEFIWQRRGRLDTMIAYYNIWAREREVPKGVLLVRYEDIHADPEGKLAEMLEFIGVTGVSPEVIERSVARNDFSQLKKREKQGAYDTHRLRPGKEGDPESFKARRGKAGGYVDYLSAEDIERITSRVEAELDPWYGYGQ